MKKISYRKIFCAVLACLLLQSCGNGKNNAVEPENVENAVEEVIKSETNETNNDGTADEDYYPEAKYSEFDLNTDIGENAVYIELSSADSVSGIEVGEGYIKITNGGDYVLSGEYNGQVVVESEENVHLILNGVNISADMAPIYVKSAKNVSLTLADGSVNVISDTENYTYEGDNDEPAAAVYSKADLTVNGSGELTVNGNYDKGIHSKDDLKIVSGTINVNSKGDAIKGKDCLLVRDGKINIVSDEDGLKSNNDSNEKKGYVIIDGGVINISVGDDGIHAESWLIINGGDINISKCYEGVEGKKVEIYGGNINIVSSDDSINAASGSSTDEFGGFDFGNMDFGGRGDGKGNGRNDRNQMNNGEMPEMPEMANGEMPEMPEMANGEVPEMPNMANGEMPEMPEMANGEMPEMPEMANGEMPEMPEMANGEMPEMPEMANGEMPEMPNMDSEETNGFFDKVKDFFGGMGGGFGGGMPNEEPEEGVYIKIAGGNITATGGNDVLDSNGTLEISGGNLIIKNTNMSVYGEPDCIIDTNGTAEITGGTFVAYSRNASDKSFTTLPSFSIKVTENDSTVVVCDKDGKEVLSFEGALKCNAMFVTSDKLEVGESYTVTCGSESYTVIAE